MRIKEPAAKAGYLLVVVVGIALTAIPLTAVNFILGFAWGVVAIVAAVVIAARTFRGATESDAPRPWWKMTSTRGSGILLCVLFFLQGAIGSVGAFASSNPPLALIGSSAALVVALFYLNSAVRIQPASASA